MKLVIYMKSGSKIELRGVKKWYGKMTHDAITSLTVEHSKIAMFFGYGPRLIVPSIDLTQIEAITVD